MLMPACLDSFSSHPKHFLFSHIFPSSGIPAFWFQIFLFLISDPWYLWHISDICSPLSLLASLSLSRSTLPLLSFLHSSYLLILTFSLPFSPLYFLPSLSTFLSLYYPSLPSFLSTFLSLYYPSLPSSLPTSLVPSLSITPFCLSLLYHYPKHTTKY
jgi:hypothetical protein